MAANYIESIGALSASVSIYRLRISKMEVRECGLWLRLLNDCTPPSEHLHVTLDDLLQEADELVKIFAAIIRIKSPDEPLP